MKRDVIMVIKWMYLSRLSYSLFLFLVLSLTICHAKGPKLNAESFSSYAKTEPTRSADAWNVLIVPAVVSVDPQATWSISPPHDGELRRWEVDLGDVLNQGDVLAEVSLHSISDLKAKLKSSQRVSAARSRRMKSIERQVRSGSRAQESLDEAEVALEEARAVVESTRMALRARTRNGSSALKWKSEVSGVITSLRCAPGAAIEAHQPCLTISDTKRLIVSLKAPMQSLSSLILGQAAIWTESGARRRVEKDTQGVELVLRAVIPPRDTSPIGEAIFIPKEGHRLPGVGLAGVIEVSRPTPNDVVWVPRSSLVEWGGISRVFVMKTEGPRAVQVQVLGGFNGGIVCRSPELKLGDEVVTRGAFALKSQALLTEEE